MRLELPSAGSLKEKRRLLKSLITRLRNDFNISVAEVGDNDIHRRALIGIAVVANNGSYGHQVMTKVTGRVESESEIILSDVQVESY